ncbi:hypothetical protein GQ54DRAFT_225784 [Martensiomyces pterosporus]|nr:hypothetical protein GQ54DRAFT_225784 [Martensiomyces pterosporus]
MHDFDDMTPRTVSRRPNNAVSNSSASKPEPASTQLGRSSRSVSSPKLSRHVDVRQGQHNNHNHSSQQQQYSSPSTARSDIARKNPPQKQPRQYSRGKQNNSNQRPHAMSEPLLQKHDGDTSNDDQKLVAVATPTKKSPKSSRRHNGSSTSSKQQQQPKVTLLTKAASEGEQQTLLAKFAAPTASNSNSGRPVAKRNRRRQGSPPRVDNDLSPSHPAAPSSPTQPAAMHSASVPAKPHYSQQQQQQMRTPTRRPHKQQAGATTQPHPLSGPVTIYSPTPRAAYPAAPAAYGGAPPPRGGSPAINKSNHYAGASFNNSPAPSTLPLPPSFLTTTAASPSMPSPAAVSGRSSSSITRDEDVFGVAPSGPISPEQLFVRRPAGTQVNAASALSERSRQLEDMLLRGNVIHHQQPATAADSGSNHHSYSSVDLTQPATELSAMFQKLRLIKEMSQNRPATVSPVPSNRVLASAYNA